MDKITCERWLPITNYENAYEVSNRGQVRSVDRTIEKVSRWGTLITCNLRGRILKVGNGTNDYLLVKLSRNGIETSHMVHVLVLTEFEGPKPEGAAARHGKGGRHDNRWPENLCWGTYEENADDKIRDHTTPRGEQCGTSKLTWPQVCEIRRLRNEKGLLQRTIAEMFDVTIPTVSLIVRYKIWRYPPEEW